MYRIEYQTRFSLMHQKRAGVIGELYSSMAEIEELLKKLVGHPLTLSGVPFNLDDLIDAYDRTRIFYHRNRIYFEDAICQQVERVLNVLHEIITTGSRIRADKAITQEQAVNAVEESIEKIEHVFPVLMKQLEKDFKSVLGVSFRKDEQD